MSAKHTRRPRTKQHTMHLFTFTLYSFHFYYPLLLSHFPLKISHIFYFFIFCFFRSFSLLMEALLDFRGMLFWSNLRSLLILLSNSRGLNFKIYQIGDCNVFVFGRLIKNEYLLYNNLPLIFRFTSQRLSNKYSTKNIDIPMQI